MRKKKEKSRHHLGGREMEGVGGGGGGDGGGGEAGSVRGRRNSGTLQTLVAFLMLNKVKRRHFGNSQIL